MPPGGPRSGVPGAQYANRSDLQNGPRTAGQEDTYGDGTRRAAVKAAPDSPPMGNLLRGGGIPPGKLTPLDAPTMRPHEPVTAGVPAGAGAGPEVMQQGPTVDQQLWELRSLAARFPEYTDLARVLGDIEAEL